MNLEKKHEWQSVFTALPEEDENVLVYYKDAVQKYERVLFATFHRNFNRWLSCGEKLQAYEVTHWMRLPDPPTSIFEEGYKIKTEVDICRDARLLFNEIGLQSIVSSRWSDEYISLVFSLALAALEIDRSNIGYDEHTANKIIMFMEVKMRNFETL